MTPQGPCRLRNGRGTGLRSPRRRHARSRPARANLVTGRPTGLGITAEPKAAGPMHALPCRSGFPGLAVMPGHRSHMSSHSPGCKVCVLVPYGEVDAGVLTKLPFAEPVELVVEAGASLEHRLPQRPHDRSKNLVVSGVANSQVEAHALRGRRLILLDGRFMRLQNRRELADLSIG